MEPTPRDGPTEDRAQGHRQRVLFGLCCAYGYGYGLVRLSLVFVKVFAAHSVHFPVLDFRLFAFVLHFCVKLAKMLANCFFSSSFLDFTLFSPRTSSRRVSEYIGSVFRKT